MANKVSFIIQFRDKFSRTAASLNRQFKSIDKNATKSGGSIKRMAAASSFSLRKLASVAKSVTFDPIGRSADRAKAKIKSMQLQSGKIGRKALQAGAVSTAAITLPAVLIGKSMVTAASDATETANKFNTVFENVKSKANNTADEFAKSFGVAGSTARKLIGDTGDLLVGLGAEEGQALALSKRLVEVSADLASFQNLQGGAADAANRLTKGATGEVESLKLLGIVIRQDTKEFKDLVAKTERTKGVSKSLAKATVIINQAIEQSKKAIGDVSRTWDDYASVVRRSNEKTKELKESFGKLMIPAATKLTNKLITLTEWLTNLSPGMKKLILSFTAMVAITGPLLVAVGALAIAFSVLGIPILAASAAVVGFIAVGTLALFHWEAIIGTLKLMWADFSTYIMGIVTSIEGAFTALWEGRFVDAIKNGMNVAVKLLNGLIKPITNISSLLGFGSIKIPEFNVPKGNKEGLGSTALSAVSNLLGLDKIPEFNASTNTPTVPLRPTQGTINGQLTVSAAPGTEVKKMSMTNKGSGLNVGMNMAKSNGG